MTPKQKALVAKNCESNQEWAAQMMLENLKPAERHMIACALRKLDNLLYKSWAKDMSLTELLEAVKLTSPYEEKNDDLAVLLKKWKKQTQQSQPAGHS